MKDAHGVVANTLTPEKGNNAFISHHRHLRSGVLKIFHLVVIDDIFGLKGTENYDKTSRSFLEV